MFINKENIEIYYNYIYKINKLLIFKKKLKKVLYM